jgi:hypothetical protein
VDKVRTAAAHLPPVHVCCVLCAARQLCCRAMRAGGTGVVRIPLVCSQCDTESPIPPVYLQLPVLLPANAPLSCRCT